MLVDGQTPLQVRRVSSDDEALLLEWANDPTTRAHAFSSDPIAPETHHRWLAGRLAFADSRLYIAQTAAGTPVGQVRFDRREAGWEIDYSIAPAFRGRRLGTILLRKGMHALGTEFPDATVIGRVKPANEPSLKVFRALGFESGSDEQGAVFSARVTHG
jgi:RimJ/RimL family protein N-acetyltransferase